MTNKTGSTNPPTAKVIAGFGSIYLIWGSTFLATRFAVQTIPPFLMVSIRFMSAGGILVVWSLLRGAPRPTSANLRAALTVSAPLFVGGMASGAWALQFVPSGLAAVLIATSPMWIVILDWLWLGAPRPNRSVILGFLLGFAGIVLIVGPDRLLMLLNDQDMDSKLLLGIGVMLLSALSWATGSIYTRRARLPDTPLMASGLQMLVGGLELLLIATIIGDFSRLDIPQIALRSVLSLGYLAIFGSIIAFSTYIWLLQVSSPTRVSSYAYVNPIVALFVGWAIGGEPLSPRTLLACAVIIIGVVLITTHRVKTPQAGPQQPIPEPSHAI